MKKIKFSSKQKSELKSIILTATIFAMILILGTAFASIAYADTSFPSIQISVLNQNPDPARAGDTVTLRFKIENTGGQAAQNVAIELLQDYPFTIASGSAVKNIDSISAYQSGNNYVTVEYQVKIDKDAQQGAKDLKVKYKYGTNAWATLTFSINIASNEFAQIIYVNKAKISPGTETDLTFTINNIGNAPLQNMVFSWNEATGVILPVYSGDSKYIKYLDAGQSIDLTYKVIADVNANPGLYQLDLNLKYESVADSTSSILTTKAGVMVGGETDFDVAFSESTAGQTSLSVANTGNNPAQSVSVKIPQQESFRVTGTNSAIIGNLDKGDYTLVSFQIVQNAMNFSARRPSGSNGNFNPSAQNPDSQRQKGNFSGAGSSGNNNLKVIIEYTDTTGARQSVEKSVPIQFRSTDSTGTTASGFSRRQQSSFFGSFWFWVIIIALVIVGYFVLKNKSRREKIIGKMSGLFKKRK